MPQIPHSFTAALSLYAPALVAFVVAFALPALGRGKVWADVAGAGALLAGWTLLHPLGLLPRVIWAPDRATEILLAPALACVVSAWLVTWRGGRHDGVAALLLAMFASWWVARVNVGQTDFWRVGFAITVLAGVIAWIVKGKAERVLALTLALWGGLAVAGAGASWMMAALVAACGAAGLAVSGAAAVVPAAAVAALLGAADLAGGRLVRGRFGVVDVACLMALAAPFLADAAALKLGRVPGRFSGVLGSAIGAAATVAAVWLLRRAFFT